MNILHINYSDILGERFNGFYMLNASDDSFTIQMAVWRKESNNDNVFILPPKNGMVKYIFEKFLHLFSKIGFDHVISIFGFYLLSKQAYFKKADIIHLHIIHGDSNLNFKSIFKICKEKKVIWTFHDQWAVTGGCIHPFDCQGVSCGCPKVCPYPRYNSLLKHCMPHHIWKVKKRLYSQSHFSIIVSTEWMMNKIKNSSLISNKNITIIPFGVDINAFKPLNKASIRIKLKIPEDDFVVMFRNTGIVNDKFKGLEYIKTALLNLKTTKSVTIIILEYTKGFEVLSSKYNIIYTGWIKQNQLIEYFSASDVFLMPSLQESFGLMALEAMSCSLPVIVADDTALPEVIGGETCGIVVKQRNPQEINEAITTLINNSSFTKQLGEQARKRVESFYSIQKCIENHKHTYAKLISKL